MGIIAKIFKKSTYMLPKNNTYDESFSDYEDFNNTYDRAEYIYVLFASTLDTNYYIGSRKDYMREDYTIDSIYGDGIKFIHKLNSLSKNLLKNVPPQKFFESMEVIELLLKDPMSENVRYYNNDLENNLYYSRKDEIICNYIKRSYENVFRKSLELKTSEGRARRIEHWISVINYYRRYMTEKSIIQYEEIINNWRSQLTDRDM